MGEKDNKKKALMVSSVASMVECFNRENIRILLDIGYEVSVATNFMKGNPISATRVQKLREDLKSWGVGMYQIDFSRKIINLPAHMKAYRQMKKVLKNDFSLIHCHSPIGGVISRLTAKPYRKLKMTRVLYTAHGFHFYQGSPKINWWIYHTIEKKLSKDTDVLITINQEDYQLAKNTFSSKKTCYVPGIGIDVEKIIAVKNKREEIRKELDIPLSSILILSVGELNKNKNHIDVIRALGIMKEYDFHYVICGVGELHTFLQKEVDKVGLKDRVHLTGYRKDIIEVMKSADIFVFPSLREGLSVSLMEAMVCGLPVVCSKIRGNVDLIEENKGGRVVDKKNTTALKNAILELLIDENKREKMREYNKKKIAANSRVTVVERMNDIYKAV